MKTDKYYNKTLEELYTIYQKNIKKMIISVSEVIGATALNPIIDFEPITFAAQGISIYDFLRQCNNFLDFVINYSDFFKNSIEYQKAYEEYSKILKEILIMCKTLEMQNEIELFCAYSYAYRRGFFSLNHTFHYSKKTPAINIYFSPLVISGEGKCMHINGMLSDLLRENNYESYRIEMCLHHCLFLNNDYLTHLPDEIEKISESTNSRTFSKIKIDPYNHLVASYKDDQHAYLLDACNNTIFGIDKTYAYQNGDRIKMNYEPIHNLNQKRKLSKIIKDSSDEIISERIQQYHQFYKRCKENKDIFETFYQEHKEMYESITDKQQILMREYQKYSPFK